MKLMTLDNRHLFECSLEDRLNLLTQVNEIIKLANAARNGGVLSLEEVIQGCNDKFLKSGILIVCDGTDHDTTRQMMENIVISSGKKGAELLKQVITLEGILSIQEGENPRVIGFKLTAMLGEDVLFSEQAEQHFGY